MHSSFIVLQNNSSVITEVRMKAVHRLGLLNKPLSRFSSTAAVENKAKYYREQANVYSDDKPEEWNAARPYGDIPGPKPWPILGNLPRVITKEIDFLDFLGLFRSLHTKYGEICAVRKILLPDFVVVFDPKEIEKVFRNEGMWPIREGFDSLRVYRNVIRHEVFGDAGGVVSSQGEKWFDFRSRVNPIMMQPRTVANYTNQINVVSTEFIENMKKLARDGKDGEMPEDFDNEINKWAFESIGLIALDTRLGCLEPNPAPETMQMIDYMLSLFKMMMLLDFSPFGKYMIKYNLPLWRKFVRYQDHFTNMCLDLMKQAQEKFEKEGYNQKEDHEKSVFQKLLEVDEKVAITMTMDMLTAGIDTTGKTTCAALYYLAKNKDVQTKLREELKQVMPNKDSPVTKDVLNNIPYLKAVIKETGRIAPIAVANVRTMTRDLVINNYQIPKGATLYAPTLYLSSLEKHYPRADHFLPERWLRETKGELSHKNTNPFVTLHFGFGPRSCVGKRFANLEMEIILAKIIRNFELDWRHADVKFRQDLIYAIRDPLKFHVKEVSA